MSRLSDENVEYIKEGDLILVQIKKGISEVLVKDISPSGNYMKITTPSGHNAVWINCIHHIETLVSGEDDDTEYVDVGEGEEEEEEDLIGDQWKHRESAQDILAKVRNRNGDAKVDEPIEAEVITQNTLAKFDRRNKRK